nr:uncharacterized protein DDB_G0284459-like isoform X2 [Onthophagus taurus]XP_022906726.1 uncharacterized protein DDB_G0284459-like isoform X2 [Onthophagus taurus]
MATEDFRECDCQEGFDPSAVKSNESMSDMHEMIVDKEPDYTEHYLALIYEDSDFEDDLKPSESIPSLPEVQVETDRCEGRIEIPWLEFSLPPPGTLQIVSRKEKPFRKKGPCQCWRNKKDVIEQDVSEQVQVPDDIGACKCTNTEKEAMRMRKEAEQAGEEEDAPEEFVEGEEAGDGEPPEEGEPPAEGEAAEDGEAQEEEEAPEEDEAPPKVEEEDECIPFKKCLCLQEEDCSNLKALRMTYDNPCFANHEPYVDGWYKHFPDDCDTECGPYTEIPWDEIIIPRNIKIKGSIRKKTKGCDTQTCPLKHGDELNNNDPNSRALVKFDKNEMVPCPNRAPSSNKTQQPVNTCACFETGKKKKKSKKTSSKELPKQNNNSSKGAQIMEALQTCQDEMEPIKSALIDIKSKISTLRQMKTNGDKTQSKSNAFPSNFSSKPCVCSCLIPPLPPYPPPPFPMSPFLPPPPMMPNKQSNDTNDTKSPTSPCTYKCKRNTTMKKDSSSTSESLKLKKKKKSKKDEESIKNKRCRCSKRLGEKMTNTRRRDCVKSCKVFNVTDNIGNNEVNGDKVYQSCPSATSGGIIIEECQ